MEKTILTREYLSSLKLLSSGEISRIYLTKTGEIVKIFTKKYIDLCNVLNINLEGKLLNAEHYYISNEIIVPNMIFYDSYGNVIGYKSKRAKGLNLNQIEGNFSMKDRTNLNKYNGIFSSLEDIVKKNKDIVFPDLCTCDNIFIDKKGKISLIDYNGMQIGKYGSFDLSTSLDIDSNNYLIQKYFQNNLFTKNLDKKSLIILYFLLVFNIDLNKVGAINPETNKPITLEEMFYIIGLDDYEIYDKIRRIFDDTTDNVYLEDSVDRIEKDYNLTIYASNGTKHLKRLIKK